MTKVVFLDRDGVLNADIGYLWRIEDFVWMPGAPAAIRLFNQLGWRVVVVTNQSGIARGYYTENDMHALHAHIQQLLRPFNSSIDAFYFCPHLPNAPLAAYAKTCDCRKPKPGMIKQALTDYDIDVDQSFLVGDKSSDLKAAQAAGLRGYLYEGGSLLAFVRNVIKKAEFD